MGYIIKYSWGRYKGEDGQTTQFENLKMNEDEDIVGFFLRVAKVVNIMIGLGEEIK